MSETGSVEFQRYRTSVLFVLVGENPLPNYVAARLLLEPGGRLYLVHSKGPGGTGNVASQLRTFLATDRSHLAACEVHLVPVDEYDAVQLHRDLEPYLARAEAQTMGLHYTGGTKFMAVHSHRVVEDICQRRGRDLILSYLHADTLQLSIEPRPGNPGLCRSVVDAVQLELADVFALHGVETINAGRSKPQFPDLAGAVAAFQCSPQAVEIWRDGVRLLESEGQRWADLRQGLRGTGWPEPLLGEMARSFTLADPERWNLADIGSRIGLGSQGSVTNWLRWQWLEDWALACVPRSDRVPRAGNIQGRSGGVRPFEIDVAFMRGYQFFAVSCKDTKARGTLKLGLMEAFTRARQMGGEEGRAALVTTYEDAAGLEAEMAADWAAKRRVRVFGCRELPDLAAHFQNWYDDAGAPA